ATSSAKGKGIYVTNFGSDTLRITDDTLVGMNFSDQANIFTIQGANDSKGNTLLPPSFAIPWIIPPDDTVYLSVLAHPHHSGEYNAYISYTNNANNYILAKTFLYVCGEAPSGVIVDHSQTPEQIILWQNYPNPVNTTTTIRFQVLEEGAVTLKIYNAIGEEITTLVSGHLSNGDHQAQWNTQGLPEGVYYYSLQSGASIETKKILLIK
ncbi:MAG: T9SS type A sorting domain-containing protein, partial [Gloeomargaritales cyanobacterium]